MTSCNLSRKNGGEVQTWAEAEALIERANQAAGCALVSDQALLETKDGSRQLFFVHGAGAASDTLPVGIVILAENEFDLVIDPSFEGNGFGGCALEQVLNVTSGNLRVWVHGNQPAAGKLLSENLFRVHRTLLMMRASREEILDKLQTNVETKKTLPEGFTLATFSEAAADEWIELNARVFAEHPEQGRLTRADLDARRAEPWFDAHHFMLLRDARNSLIGYCWMKLIDSEAELYVIGVDPAQAGKSLGSALLDSTLDQMLQLTGGPAGESEPLVQHVSLFVDEGNTSAVSLYASRGFSIARTSRQWLLARR